MYPRLSDIFQDLFGFNFPLPIYSFGAMVAIAILTASWIAGKELDRLYSVGKIKGVRLLEPKNKEKPGRRREFKVYGPSAIIGTVTIIAVVAGFAGSKIFHILENLDDFSRDPLGERGGRNLCCFIHNT